MKSLNNKITNKRLWMPHPWAHPSLYSTQRLVVPLEMRWTKVIRKWDVKSYVRNWNGWALEWNWNRRFSNKFKEVSYAAFQRKNSIENSENFIVSLIMERDTAQSNSKLSFHQHAAIQRKSLGQNKCMQFLLGELNRSRKTHCNILWTCCISA